MSLVRPLRVSVVLGGGGARGLAHVGVLAVLEEAGIHPDLIVGTSMGALIGAAYCANPSSEALKELILTGTRQQAVQGLEKRFEAFLNTPSDEGWKGWLQGLVGKVRRLVLWNRQAIRPALVDPTLGIELIEWLVGDARFEDLRIPFYALAYDLAHNRDVIIGRGHLATALRASSAIPGVFPPVCSEDADAAFVDGCVLQELPVESARRLGADSVIAVDVAPDIDPSVPVSGAETVGRVLRVRGDWVRRRSAESADTLIAPDVSGVHWSEFSRAEECFAAGEAAAREQLPALLAALRRKRGRTVLKRLFPARRQAPVEIATVEPVAVPPLDPAAADLSGPAP